MRPRTHQRQDRTWILGVLLLIAALAMTALYSFGQGELRVKGMVLAQGGDLSEASVVVELSNGLFLLPKVNSAGRFSVLIPHGTQALLRYELEGYVTKEVLVDAQNGAKWTHYQDKTRTVKFDVMLETDAMDEACFAGPVGYVEFLNGSARARIHYDYQLAYVP